MIKVNLDFQWINCLLWHVKNNVERTSSIMCILCKKDNGDILKNTIVDKLKESFMLMLEPMLFDSQHVFVSDIYVIGDLDFLFILLGKAFYSPKYYLKYKLISKVWFEYGHMIDDEWIRKALGFLSESDSTGSAELDVTTVPIWEFF